MSFNILPYIHSYRKCVNGLLKLLDTIESDHSCMYQIQALLELGKMSEALEMCVTNKFWTMSVVLASHISKEVYSKTVSAFALNSFMLNGQTLRMNANQNQYPEMNFMFEYLGGAQSIDCI